MGQWVVTVAGIAILAVLCDIILPDGQTRKYIKTVIGVVVTLVMIQPLANFIGSSLAIGGNQSSEYSNVEVQQSYIDMVDDKQFQSKLTTVQDVLQAHGVNVKVDSVNKRDKTFTIKSESTFSSESKTVIDNVFNTYFPDFKITIKWK